MAASSTEHILREFNGDDYQEYISWYKELTPPLPEDLPSVGLVVGDMKAAGFVYLTDSSFAVLAFWHSNPNNKPKVTKDAMIMLFKGLCDAAKAMGRKNAFIATNNRGIIRLLESIGFYCADGHLIKRLT